MLSVKVLCFSVCLAVIVFCVQDAHTRKCMRKVYVCPETSLNISLNNPVAVIRAKRQAVSDILTSNVIPPLSAKAAEFINRVLAHAASTDSMKLLDILYGFTLLTLPFLADAHNTPSLCILAENINSSVSWKLTQEGNVTATALRQGAVSIATLCLMNEVTALLGLGCENVPPLTPLSPRCWKRGTDYQAEKALELFGESLPCCLQVGAHDLFQSGNYVDNAIAAGFIFATTPEFQCLINDYNINVLLEPSYILIRNNVTVCCCPKRKKRFDELCLHITSTTISNVERVIRDVYLFDECGTEAHHDRR